VGWGEYGLVVRKTWIKKKQRTYDSWKNKEKHNKGEENHHGIVLEKTLD
jgi:hypothetical protein